MRAYRSLRELVCRAGATLLEEQEQADGFGSAYAVFLGSTGTSFRLIWDGKESYGFLQRQISSEEWKDAGPFVRERFGASLSDLPAPTCLPWVSR